MSANARVSSLLNPSSSDKVACGLVSHHRRRAPCHAHDPATVDRARAGAPARGSVSSSARRRRPALALHILRAAGSLGTPLILITLHNDRRD